VLHKPLNLQHLIPPAPGFIAGGRDAVPGRPALLPGLPLLATTAHVNCNSWIKMPLGTEVGLSPGDIVLVGDAAPLPHRKRHSSPHFSAHVYCGQTAGCSRIPLGTEVGLGPGDIVRWEPSSPMERGTAAPHFSTHVCCGHMVAHLCNC